MEICKHVPAISIYGYVGGQSEIQMRHLPAVYRFKRMGVRVGVANFFFVRVGVAKFFLDPSIGIDETNTFRQSIGIDETNTFHGPIDRY